MATPVVTVASGGLPVVDVTASTPKLGLPVTEALNGRGMPVTKVAGGGVPVTYSTVADYPPSNLVTNGNFTQNPLNAAPNTVQNGWQWRTTPGTGTATAAWNGSNAVTLTGDGTNSAQISTSIPTDVGGQYQITVDVASAVASVLAGIAAFQSTLLNAVSVVGLGQAFLFTATATTSFITFSKPAAANATISNVSVVKLPSGGAFTPANLTGLIGWWDAQAPANGGCSFSSGNLIQTIADQSGVGNTVTWNAFGHPTYDPTGWDGTRPCFTLANSGYMTAAAFPMGAGNTLTAWFVGKRTVSQTDGRFLSYAALGQNDFGHSGSFCLNQGGDSTTAVCITRASGGFCATKDITVKTRLILTINAGAAVIYCDGVASPGTIPSGNWVTGGNFSFGGNTSGGGPNLMQGPCLEAGVATGFSDATKAAALDNYLKTRAGM